MPAAEHTGPSEHAKGNLVMVGFMRREGPEAAPVDRALLFIAMGDLAFSGKSTAARQVAEALGSRLIVPDHINEERGLNDEPEMVTIDGGCGREPMAGRLRLGSDQPLVGAGHPFAITPQGQCSRTDFGRKPGTSD